MEIAPHSPQTPPPLYLPPSADRRRRQECAKAGGRLMATISMGEKSGLAALLGMALPMQALAS